MKYIFVVSVSVSLLLSFFIAFSSKETPYQAPIKNTDSPNKDLPMESYAELLTNMTLGDKIGQLFIIGHWAQTKPEQTAALVHTHQLGGVIIMSSPENPGDISKWTDDWQSTSTQPLVIAIDQEGGPVTRLKSSKYTQLGQTDIESSKEAYSIGKKRAEELTSLGINTNFAPVLETSINPKAFLYNRVFVFPENIVNFGSSMIRGLRDGGVVAVPKHFPGHEDTADDSHTELPILTVPTDEFDNFVQNFTDTIQQSKPSALMTAHVQVPSLDSKYPATLSYTILTKKLRESIGFTGVIITDDMTMQAITNTWSSSEASLLALQAGADMILFAAKPNDAIPAVKYILQAVENGEITEERIDESLRRIFKMKNIY
jgi:beta-N-acetylhexosaminidase